MKRFLILILTLSLFGCKEPMDKNFVTIKDDYKIGYHQNPTDNIFVRHYEDRGMMLIYVNKKVKRLGFNERFAILERMGNYDDVDAPPLDTLVVRYYILDMTRKRLGADDKDFLFGPATYDEFLGRKKELGIEELDFTKEFKVN